MYITLARRVMLHHREIIYKSAGLQRRVTYAVCLFLLGIPPAGIRP